MTTLPKARREVFFRSSLRCWNFIRSRSSRTKDFTTRMPARFSCTTRFSASVFSWRERKRGPVVTRSTATTTASRGRATRKMLLSRTLIRMEKNRAETSITGARTIRRMDIIRDICKLCTSLVSRVTREAVEKRSMLEKAKVWIWPYSARRRLAPNPMPATDEATAAPRPKHREATARATISPPFRRM